MANKEKMKKIEEKAKQLFPRKGYTRDAFIKGAVWSDGSHWIKTADERPKEGSVVFCCYDYEKKKDGSTHMGLNIATYKDGKFESYTNDDPTLWMYPPMFVEFEE